MTDLNEIKKSIRADCRQARRDFGYAAAHISVNAHVALDRRCHALEDLARIVQVPESLLLRVQRMARIVSRAGISFPVGRMVHRYPIRQP